ncbi:hypothetical protein CRG98_024087 [Punica granatum]|uniref:Uncharacterized protein n=1 Tax=Punica granatum TaxID=22663 RepID=A0A2I0JGU4_PUNGR|nr:hypothetical protein CRG98_024087 [Punica granatum]
MQLVVELVREFDVYLIFVLQRDRCRAMGAGRSDRSGRASGREPDRLPKAAFTVSEGWIEAYCIAPCRDFIIRRRKEITKVNRRAC